MVCTQYQPMPTSTYSWRWGCLYASRLPSHTAAAAVAAAAADQGWICRVGALYVVQHKEERGDDYLNASNALMYMQELRL